jgi:outer membrane protein assembly factor BamE (lipoprotein component of BamABCDE complex)
MRLSRLRLTMRRIMIGVAALGLVLGSVRLVFIDDSPDQLFLSLLLGESTVYSKGYSEQQFRTLRVGMTAAQVEAIMGPPLWKGTHPAFGLPYTWFYTTHEDVTANYKRRWVAFQNGRVVQIINDFWID